MDFITIGVGGLASVYGIASGILRIVKPSVFMKLEPMKKAYGAKAGNIIHFIGYVLIPVALGVLFIVSGVNGKSIGQIFR